MWKDKKKSKDKKEKKSKKNKKTKKAKQGKAGGKKKTNKDDEVIDEVLDELKQKQDEEKKLVSKANSVLALYRTQNLFMVWMFFPKFETPQAPKYKAITKAGKKIQEYPAAQEDCTKLSRAQSVTIRLTNHYMHPQIQIPIDRGENVREAAEKDQGGAICSSSIICSLLLSWGIPRGPEGRTPNLARCCGQEGGKPLNP